jgi:hypothetical protein
MHTKRKISLTIDDRVFRALEQASKDRDLAKSHIAQQAFELWLKTDIEMMMAKGYEEMAEEDLAMAESAVEAQKEVVS